MNLSLQQMWHVKGAPLCATPIRAATTQQKIQLPQNSCSFIQIAEYRAVRSTWLACTGGSKIGETNEPSVVGNGSGTESATVQVANSGKQSNGTPADGEAVSLEGLDASIPYSESASKSSFGTSARLALALPWRRIKKGSILCIKLEGAVSESRQGAFGRSISVPEFGDALEKAAYDPRIAGVWLTLDPIQVGWARLTELKRQIEFFKRSGKPILAYAERCSEKEYYLGSVCDKMYLTPEGSLILLGFQVQGTFLKGTLGKIGINPNFAARGKYKSAADQFAADTMSPYAEEQLSDILEGVYDHFVAHVSTTRGIPRDTVVETINQLVYDPEELVAKGFLTGLKYKDEVEKELCELLGVKRDKLDKRLVSYKKYSQVGRSAFGIDGKETVAVLRVVGPIVGGSPQLSNAVQANKVVAKLRRLGEKKDVKAVVLRVESPGGDALASDLMYREIMELNKKKPVIASMGDVAASGGYYLSMACPTIVAEELTITGSIGVVAGKFATKELADKIGYKKKVLYKGDYQQLFSPDKDFNDKEKDKFVDFLNYAYERFRNKAATSRKMSPEEMEEHAQGRVWLGSAALKNGLVDALGGVSLAVKMAKRKAKIPDDKSVRVLEVNPPLNAPVAGLLASASGSSLEEAQKLLAQFEGENVFKLLWEVVLLTAAQFGVLAAADNWDYLSEQGKVMLKAVNIDVDGIGAAVQQSGPFVAYYQAQDVVVRSSQELASIPQHLVELVQNQLAK